MVGWCRQTFGGLVLGCTEAKNFKESLIFQHFSITTTFTRFCTIPNSTLYKISPCCCCAASAAAACVRACVNRIQATKMTATEEKCGCCCYCCCCCSSCCRRHTGKPALPANNYFQSGESLETLKRVFDDLFSFYASSELANTKGEEKKYLTPFGVSHEQMKMNEGALLLTEGKLSGR